MTKPLTDPVLEAAVQIKLASTRNHPALSGTNIKTIRSWACSIPRQCHVDMIAEAARQIDALRAAGVLPEMEAPSETKRFPNPGTIWRANDGRVMELLSWTSRDAKGRMFAVMRVINAQGRMRQRTLINEKWFGDFLKPHVHDH
ncbi:MAG: hypothetical protein KGI54_16720 [Pseudomonadota bacterium]|nr:hypothetical protein [Pseudomonadota bacterium]